VALASFLGDTIFGCRVYQVGSPTLWEAVMLLMMMTHMIPRLATEESSIGLDLCCLGWRQGYGQQIASRRYHPPGFQLELGMKDVRLIRDTANREQVRGQHMELLGTASGTPVLPHVMSRPHALPADPNTTPRWLCRAPPTCPLTPPPPTPRRAPPGADAAGGPAAPPLPERAGQGPRRPRLGRHRAGHRRRR
jgi:hypothetical protein